MIYCVSSEMLNTTDSLAWPGDWVGNWLIIKAIFVNDFSGSIKGQNFRLCIWRACCILLMAMYFKFANIIFFLKFLYRNNKNINVSSTCVMCPDKILKLYWGPQWRSHLTLLRLLTFVPKVLLACSVNYENDAWYCWFIMYVMGIVCYTAVLISTIVCKYWTSW